MIEHEAFVNWAKDNFNNVLIHGDEVKIPDVWWERNHGSSDHKCHCWVNTSKACFNAFKSGEHGHLIELVMQVENCSWDDAVDVLGGEDSIRMLGSRLQKFFQDQNYEFDELKHKNLKLPNCTFLIRSLSETNLVRKQCENYLQKRRLPVGNLMICTEGEYADRIIIPYYDNDGNLIYFNGRDITGKKEPKYKGPDKDKTGVGKADVLWTQRWPNIGDHVYLTEGEFDALSLFQCGLNAFACGGKTVSPTQIEILRPYQVTVGFDGDSAGEEGLLIAAELKSSGLRNTKFVWPPKKFKDWNELFISHGPNVVRGWIEQAERPVSDMVIIKRGLDKI